MNKSNVLAALVLVLALAMCTGIIIQLNASGSKANHTISRLVREELTTHARASARRSCAIARLLEIHAQSTPETAALVKEACLFVPIR